MLFWRKGGCFLFPTSKSELACSTFFVYLHLHIFNFESFISKNYVNVSEVHLRLRLVVCPRSGARLPPFVSSVLASTVHKAQAHPHPQPILPYPVFLMRFFHCLLVFCFGFFLFWFWFLLLLCLCLCSAI